jgi:hypothetical protein
LFGSEIADCGGVTRIEELNPPDSDGIARDATAEDAYSAWFVMTNSATALHDTGFAAAVSTTPRAVLTGSTGSIELTGDMKLIVRRPRQDLESFEFALPARGEPDPALVTFFGQIAEALQTGTQITPSFDDGVAVAEAMDRLRANAVAAP